MTDFFPWHSFRQRYKNFLLGRGRSFGTLGVKADKAIFRELNPLPPIVDDDDFLRSDASDNLVRYYRFHYRRRPYGGNIHRARRSVLRERLDDTDHSPEDHR